MMNDEYDMTMEGSDTESGPFIYVGKSDMKRGLMRNAVFKSPLPEWLLKICDEDSTVKANILTVKEYAERGND